MMMNCDTLLTVGSSFPYTQFMPKFDQARGVQIDIDGKFIGMRYPYEVNLVGDAAATFGADPAPQAQGGPLLAGGDRGGRSQVVAVDGRRGRRRSRSGQPDAAVP